MDTMIWRYMDLSKLIDLLSRKELFFTRSDKFEDPFEGATTQFDYENRLKHLAPLDEMIGKKSVNIKCNDEWVKLGSVEGTKDHESVFKKVRELTFINCWHRNNVESEAMWKLYLKSGEGIAIQTTTEKLRMNIAPPFEKNLEINSVNYIDYEKQEMDRKYGNSTVFFHKRNHFEHEKELRAIVNYVHTKDIGEEYKVMDVEEQSKLHGVHVPIKDVNNLIEKVYISPTAPDWFTDVVVSVLQKYELVDEEGKTQIPYQSTLKSKPIY